MTAVRAVGLPTIRVVRSGFTFRWGRGDKEMTVHRGDCRSTPGCYGDATLVDTVPTGGDWRDQGEVHLWADRWLASHVRTNRPG